MSNGNQPGVVRYFVPDDGSPPYKLSGDEVPQPWCSYRQWLAGMALQGYRANPRFGDFHESDVAKQCWRDADALLSAQEGQA